MRQGEPGESMFVLLEGTARVFVEPDTHVALIDAGGCFGEMSLLTGDARTASVAARTDCLVVEIGPDAFRQIAASTRGAGAACLARRREACSSRRGACRRRDAAGRSGGRTARPHEAMVRRAIRRAVN